MGGIFQVLAWIAAPVPAEFSKTCGRHSWLPTATTVRACDNLEKVAVGIFEIEAAPTIIMIDLTRLALCGISPVGEGPFSDPIKNSVELCFADEKSIMLWGDFAVSIHEIDVSAVVCCNDLKRAPPPRRRQA